jgi:putative ABC transport system permease protein
MIRNYFHSAIRFFLRNKVFSFINLLSLAIGLACVIVISSWVLFELHYDSFHQKADRIYRLSSAITMSGEENFHPTHHAPVGEMVAEEFPDVECMTRFSRAHSRLFKHADETILVEDVHYVDSSFFTIFNFDLIEGDPHSALSRPNTLIVCQSIAKNLFADQSPIGKVLESDDQIYTITGVVADPPENSTLQFKVLEPMITATAQFGGFSYGHGMAFQTWLLLKPNVNLVELENKIVDLMDREVNNLFKSINVRITGFLEPLGEIYLNSKVNRQAVKGNKRTIIIFSVSALLVLVIACFNFINLSTAYALHRSREVGVRKVFGASRTQLMLQHVGESILLVTVAMVLALVLAEVASPLIESVSGKELALFSKSAAYFLIGIPLIVLVVGVGAGWYPAIFLSRFSPTSIFRQPLERGAKGVSFRSVLAFLQFAILQALAICTMVVFVQIQHLRTKDLGFNPHNLISVRINTPSLEDKHKLLKEAIAADPKVVGATLHSFTLGHTILARDFVMEGSPEALNISYMTIDDSYLKTYGMEMVEGRMFKEPLENESGKVVVNETFVKRFGYENPIGRKIFLPNNPDHSVNEIVGVVNDFNFLSLHRKVEPLVMMTWHDPIQFVSIRLKDDDIQQSLIAVRIIWDNIAGDTPFLYFFVDEKLGELYVKENRFGSILGVFTLLAIAIACAGLFGLTAHITQSRRKELAIRKVLGANTSTLTALISLSFVKWVVLASLVAWPTAWFIASNWLDNFANRISMPLWAYVLATVVSLFVALATTLVKTYVASNQNPAVTLKYE